MAYQASYFMEKGDKFSLVGSSPGNLDIFHMDLLLFLTFQTAAHLLWASVR